MTSHNLRTAQMLTVAIIVLAAIAAIHSRFDPTTPRRAAAIYLGFMGILLYGTASPMMRGWRSFGWSSPAAAWA